MPRKGGCPLCGNPVVQAFRPFCSRGCRDRDLLAWFGEKYRTPGRPADEEEDSAPPSGQDD